MSSKYCYPLLKNVHLSIPEPASGSRSGTTYLTQGDFLYFHYKCDDFNDVGWGCAYRSLQTVSSWIISVLDRSKLDTNDLRISNIREIQKILVEIGDKTQEFVGSKNWIGALEVFYVIDKLYNVSCKIVHISRNEDLKGYANVLKKYFEEYGGLVMMGGDIDASSKGIAGIHITGNQAYLLVIDPHFVGIAKTANDLIEKGYVRWQHTSEFVDSSFYNLCLPQIKAPNLN